MTSAAAVEWEEAKNLKRGTSGSVLLASVRAEPSAVRAIRRANAILHCAQQAVVDGDTMRRRFNMRDHRPAPRRFTPTACVARGPRSLWRSRLVLVRRGRVSRVPRWRGRSAGAQVSYSYPYLQVMARLPRGQVVCSPIPLLPRWAVGSVCANPLHSLAISATLNRLCGDDHHTHPERHRHRR